ncbi:uncharacterized protein ACIBXB_021995 [Morphnus guianensis]
MTSGCPSAVSAKASLAVNQPFGTHLPSRSDDQNPQSLRDLLEPTQRHFQRGGEERKCGFWGWGWRLSSPQLGEAAPAWELQVSAYPWESCCLCKEANPRTKAPRWFQPRGCSLKNDPRSGFVIARGQDSIFLPAYVALSA